MSLLKKISLSLLFSLLVAGSAFADLDLRTFGAKCDAGATDDTVAIQKALNAAAVLKTGVHVTGTCKVTAQLTWPTFTDAGRTVAVPLRGDGYHESVISSTFVGYAFALASGADQVVVSSIQFSTTTGGFVTIGGDVGGLHIDQFFMNGCAATYFSILHTSGTIYTASIKRSRFWNNAGYNGGVLSIAQALNVELESSFISQQKKDGSVIVLANTKNFKAKSVQFETPTGATTTAQVFIELTGQMFTFEAENIYLEGTWNTFVKQSANQTTVGKLKNVFAWQYAAASGGNASPVILDISNSANHRSWSIEGLVYLNDHTSAGTGYIINDPYHMANLTRFRNTSSGNQLLRFVKQSYIGQGVAAADANFYPNEPWNAEEFRGNGVQNANQGSGAATTWKLYLPTDVALGGDASKIIEGEYLLTLTIRSADANHAVTADYIVTFDNDSNDYATVRVVPAGLIGSATYDPPSLADGAGTTTTVTVTGALLGDFAQASFSLDLQGITVTAYVSAADTVSVRLQNESGGTLDLASGTLRALSQKTQLTKGTFPTGLTVTVNNVGVVTVTANQGGGITQAHDLRFFWKRLHTL